MTTTADLASTTVGAILTGRVAPLGARRAPSGIVKKLRRGPVLLGFQGFEGDEQGDLRVHGGPEKAVHHYPHDHYPAWRNELGREQPLDRRGAFGENISTQGLLEIDVSVGDVFRVGTAVVQVSQGRQPCWKLNERFQVADMARRVQVTGRTGWYYRVLEPGSVSQDDEFLLLDSPAADWTVERIWRALYVSPLDREALAGLAHLAPLAEGWRQLAAARLSKGRLEDWAERLGGPVG